MGSLGPLSCGARLLCAGGRDVFLFSMRGPLVAGGLRETDTGEPSAVCVCLSLIRPGNSTGPRSAGGGGRYQMDPRRGVQTKKKEGELWTERYGTGR